MFVMVKWVHLRYRSKQKKNQTEPVCSGCKKASPTLIHKGILKENVFLTANLACFFKWSRYQVDQL